jgi:chitodextrinase
VTGLVGRRCSGPTGAPGGAPRPCDDVRPVPDPRDASEAPKCYVSHTGIGCPKEDQAPPRWGSMGSRRAKSTIVALALLAAGGAAASEGAPVRADPTAAESKDEHQAPSPPLGLTALPASPTQIVLAWVAPPDAAAIAQYEVLQGDEPVVATGGVSVAVSGLAPWREYCYRVRSRDASGAASAPSAQACARTPDTQPPTVPTGVAVKPLSETEVEITWAPSKDDGGIAWYEVRRDTRGALAAVVETHTRERLLEPWTRYCYTVRALDLAGNWSAPSAEACARTPERNPPTAPPALVARAKSDTEVELSWGDATDDFGVARYEVSRDGRTFAQGAATATHEGGLRPGRRYCYEVVAVDGAENRSPAARACVETPDVTAPTAPQQLAATGASSTEVVLQFEPSKDDDAVAGYEILRGSKLVAKVSAPHAGETGLRAGAEYCYRVRAFDAAGNRSPEAGPACASTATDPLVPAAPRHLRATPTERGLELEWDPAPGSATAYSVSRENDAPLGATRTTRFTLRALKPGEKHCYRVAAVDDQGRFSPRSLPACIVSTAVGPAQPIQRTLAETLSSSEMPGSRD